MCSESPNALFFPIEKEHAPLAQKYYPNLPENFFADFIAIATNGIHTELSVANTLLTIVHNLVSGKIETGTNWRASGSGILFSAIGKDFHSKFQTEKMAILHESVIPWLATENAREYEALLAQHGIRRVFMHSCGEQAFFEKDWSEQKKQIMLAEQKVRTRIDYTVGTTRTHENEIRKHGIISTEMVRDIAGIVDRSYKMYDTTNYLQKAS